MVLPLIAVAVGAGVGGAAFAIKNLYHVCQPNEILIFAGSSQVMNGRD